jgi:tRNA-dihydrouridine synthase 3
MEPTTQTEPMAVTPKHDLENGASAAANNIEHPSKKQRLETVSIAEQEVSDGAPKRVKGVAPIRAEYAWTSLPSVDPLLILTIIGS